MSRGIVDGGGTDAGPLCCVHGGAPTEGGPCTERGELMCIICGEAACVFIIRPYF